MSSVAGAAPLGSTFTHQGQVTDAGQPATGLYHLQACVFDVMSGGSALFCAPDFGDVPVDAGLFTLGIDVGSAVFSGEARYLELRVRPGNSTGGYTVLAPRQLIRATPEALRAATTPWSGVSGKPAGFADNVDNDSGGTVTSLSAGTGLSGGIIVSAGTIAIADGGVGPTQMAAGAVGLAQINSAQVQARVGGSCAVGEYVRGSAGQAP